jgi:NTP pyrophosphatase (non-canonical NTP hydrolase)
MLTFRSLQEQVKKWREYNFPGSPTHQPLLGATEELGELIDVLFPVALANKIGTIAHCHLKAEQGIRGDKAALEEEAKDAIGDLLVYLADFCERKNWSMQDIIEEVWAGVQRRDWQKDPEHGGCKDGKNPPPPPPDLKGLIDLPPV